MRILYHIPFRYGLGADRWIFEGFRDAFTDLAHEVSVFENHENLGEVLRNTSPNLFLTSQNDLLLLGQDFLGVLRRFRGGGGKVFVRLGEDFGDTEAKKRLLRTEGWQDAYFTSYSETAMEGFQKVSGVGYTIIPLAANPRTHFPVAPVPRYQCDVCFIGANLWTKKERFGRLLFPLLKNYHVIVFGPGWTAKDKALGALGRASKKMRWHRMAEVLYGMRVQLPVNEERFLYSSAKISLNIHPDDGKGGVLNISNEREFKIPAAGGFELTDNCAGIEKFFVPGKEIVIAKDDADWFRKIDYYLRNERAREEIRARGIERARHEHTYRRRAEEMLKLYASIR